MLSLRYLLEKSLCSMDIICKYCSLEVYQSHLKLIRDNVQRLIDKVKSSTLLLAIITKNEVFLV
jgi:hypothetical protein